VLVMLVAPLVIGVAVALQPLQLLWLNLLTDGLLGLGLGVEPAERDTMRRPPRDPQAGIFSEGLGVHVAWVGILIGAVALVAGLLTRDRGNPADESWQTMMFTTLAFLQIGQALASRSDRESFFTQGLRSNLTLMGLVILVIVLQLIVLYVPFLDQFFNIVPLSPSQFWAIEVEKWIVRKRDRE
jgi:P-type Ca2+ transporter type 2C